MCQLLSVLPISCVPSSILLHLQYSHSLLLSTPTLVLRNKVIFEPHRWHQGFSQGSSPQFSSSLSCPSPRLPALLLYTQVSMILHTWPLAQRLPGVFTWVSPDLLWMLPQAKWVPSHIHLLHLLLCVLGRHQLDSLYLLMWLCICYSCSWYSLSLKAQTM